MGVLFFDDFEYANSTLYAAAWPPGFGSLATGPNPDYSVNALASPFNDQYVSFVGEGGSQSPPATPFGSSHNLVNSRTFTGLAPNTDHKVSFWMDFGGSSDSVLGGFPNQHDLCCGVIANNGVLGQGSAVFVYALRTPGGGFVGVPPLATFPVTLIEVEPMLDGSRPILRTYGISPAWTQYAFTATSDASGHIVLSFGVFDARWFNGSVQFDGIKIETIPAPSHKGPPPQVIGYGRP